MNIFNFLINWTNFVFWIITTHFYKILAIIIVFFFLRFIKNNKDDNLFLQSKFWFIILDWKFWTWKNRFMTNLQKESKNYIILSNYYSWYTNIRWNSLDDLKNLLIDVWKISEYQNFTIEETKEYYKNTGEQLKLKIENYERIKKNFKNIPKNWYFTKFLFTCDEFQNLFFWRNSLSNFSWENKILLKLFHQVRHLNSMFVFTTQNADELDLKFRRLATYYINTWDSFNDWFFWYNIFYFDTNLAKQKLNESDLQRINKTPIIKLNKYKLNNIILDWNFFIHKLFRKYKKSFIKKFDIKFRFDELQFNSKFNADPEHSIYNPWDLMIYLNNFYKNKKNIDKINYYI